jgi:hypothetical protein
VVCGLTVSQDDAIGVLASGISHAECALVRQLESAEAHEPGRCRACPPHQRSSVSDARWSALLNALESNNDDERPR